MSVEVPLTWYAAKVGGMVCQPPRELFSGAPSACFAPCALLSHMLTCEPAALYVDSRLAMVSMPLVHASRAAGSVTPIASSACAMYSRQAASPLLYLPLPPYVTSLVLIAPACEISVFGSLPLLLPPPWSPPPCWPGLFGLFGIDEPGFLLPGLFVGVCSPPLPGLFGAGLVEPGLLTPSWARFSASWYRLITVPIFWVSSASPLVSFSLVASSAATCALIALTCCSTCATTAPNPITLPSAPAARSVATALAITSLIRPVCLVISFIRCWSAWKSRWIFASSSSLTPKPTVMFCLLPRRT